MFLTFRFQPYISIVIKIYKSQSKITPKTALNFSDFNALGEFPQLKKPPIRKFTLAHFLFLAAARAAS